MEGKKAPISKSKSISITDIQEKMVEEIKMASGFMSDSTVFQVAIVNLHRKYYPNYMSGRGSGQQFNSDPRSIQSRAENKVKFKKAEKEAAREIFLEGKRKICTNLLEGIVDGSSCKYTVHNMFKDYEQVLPLDMVNEELANNLYIPNKASVLKVRHEEAKKLKGKK